MPGVIRPPWGAPAGPELSDGELVRTFAQGSRTGHSGYFHIEDRVLLAERSVTVSIRCGPTTLLVRSDVDTAALDEHLEDFGLALQMHDPDLAVVIALQVAGLPAAEWDLWGVDLETATSHLGEAAADPPLSALGKTS